MTGATNLAKTLGFGLIVGLLFSAQTVAQVRYSPEHPEVKEMADKAVKWLTISGDVGEATLASIAVIQYHKRYNNQVPKIAAIDNTIRKIQGMFNPNSTGDAPMYNQGECYFMALAVILLCEYDAVKYEKEIKELLEIFKDRQTPGGYFTYLGQDGSADTSQTQFACLAMWVAKTKGFNVDLEMAQKTLNWLCRVHNGSGQWSYRFVGTSPSSGSTLSMQAAGLSSAYLMADMLQLNGRRKDMTKSSGGEIGFPRTVRIYVPPKDDGGNIRKDGPLVKFDRGLLNNTFNAGNRSLAGRFSYSLRSWNYYYLYAVERYAYFREQAEGDPGSEFKEWYDNGIDYMKTTQNDEGSFPAQQLETKQIATAFAILFLVRSSEVINLPPADSRLNGIGSFATDANIQDDNGDMREIRAEQDLQDMLDMLKDDKKASQAQLARINEALKKQISEFRQKDDKSRGEIKSFLRSMVGAKDYYRRLIAVRFLAGEQDMENVPALIYALGDPDFRVCIEAHDGLRLISRKIDTMKLTPTTVKNARRDPDVIEKEGLEDDMRTEFRTMEKKWTAWFKKIRPDAELLGSSEK